MCGLGDLVEKRGIAIGIKQGLEQGLVQGLEQGKFEALLNAARNIMIDFNVDELKALKSVGVDEKDYPIYLEALKNAE